MNKIEAKVTIKKQIVSGEWCMFSAIPAEKNSNLKLNKYGNIALVGTNLSFLVEGHVYDLILTPKEHPKYGINYEVESVPMLEKIDEMTPEENFNLLCEITTPRQAEYIQEAYPLFVKMVLEGREDEIDYNNIYNVGSSYFQVYCENIKSQFSFFQIKAKFKEYKLNDKDCKKLLKIYGNLPTIKEKLESYPYHVLIHNLERSFLNTDVLIQEIRPDLSDSEQRCEYAMYDMLKSNEKDGNTRIDAYEMATYTPSSCTHIIPKMKDVAIKSDYIYFDEDSNYISLMSTYQDELYIANTFKKMIEANEDLGIDWKQYTQSDYISLTDEQSKLLEMANSKNICMLIGNAGSGKTSAIQALIEMIEDHAMSYTLLAPTGIASKRLSEATHRPASTIHRKVGGGAHIGTKFLIVDEISMCGIEHLSMICRNIDADYTKLILVGDNAQLASIACGNILEDVINSKKVPSATLTKIFRYGKGSLTTVATDIRESRKFIDDAGNKIFKGAEDDNQFEFIPATSEAKEQVMEVYKRLLQTYDAKDIIILSPYNKGAHGTRAINNAIQEEYNPEDFIGTTLEVKHSNFSINFRKRDRVINTSNNYDALTVEMQEKIEKAKIKASIGETESQEDGWELENQVSIFNGDMGVVRQVTEDNSLIVQIDEKLIVYNKDEAHSLLLGNAISIHKVQGSASKAIILLTTRNHSYMMSNNLMYVGATRSTDKLVWIGDINTINNALDKHETQHRETWLMDLLMEDKEYA